MLTLSSTLLPVMALRYTEGCSHVLWNDNTPTVCTRDKLQLENQGESGSLSVLYLHEQETSPGVHQFGQSTLSGFHKHAKPLSITSMM